MPKGQERFWNHYDVIKTFAREGGSLRSEAILAIADLLYNHKRDTVVAFKIQSVPGVKNFCKKKSSLKKRKHLFEENNKLIQQLTLHLLQDKLAGDSDYNSSDTDTNSDTEE